MSSHSALFRAWKEVNNNPCRKAAFPIEKVGARSSLHPLVLPFIVATRVKPGYGEVECGFADVSRWLSLFMSLYQAHANYCSRRKKLL